MTQKELVETILNSGITAFNKYYEMSDQDSWVYYTPEYWYTSNIAAGIKKSFPQYAVLLENSVSEFRSYAGSSAGRPSQNYRTSGRADIALWKHCKKSKEWEAKSLIEIKKAWGWNKSTLGPDIDRICASLLETGKKQESGSVKNGYLVIATDATAASRAKAKEKIEKTQYKLKDKISDYISDKSDLLFVHMTEKFSPYHKVDNSIAAIIVLRFGIKNEKTKK